MRVRRLLAVLAFALAPILLGATVPAWAADADADGDGIHDAVDVCGSTPPGAAVDADGRPVGDIDLDCDTDLADYFLFQQGFTGPLAPSLFDMAIVPRGAFEMGDPWSEGGPTQRPVHDVYVSTYYIDKYQVTNAQYASALNWANSQGELITVIGGVVYQVGSETSYPYCDTVSSSSYSRITWDGATFNPVAGKEDHPMSEVRWYGAVAYCNWRSAMEGKPFCYDLSTWTCNFDVPGYRLPTEAEWEKAAGWDPEEERHYRFGEHTDGCGHGCLDGQRANYRNSGDPFESGDDPETTPKGFFNGELHYKVDFGWPGSETSYQTQNAQSYYGCYDMTGNLWEWCHDWYDSDYYDSSPYYNPQGPASGTLRVLRGGDWFMNAGNCRSANRSFDYPGSSSVFQGFRCAVGTP